MPTDRLDAAEYISRSRPTSTFANIQRIRAAQSSALPPLFQDAVPQCAQRCLAKSIEQGWACSDDDTACLCSKYNPRGFTLGERAYICVVQECANKSYDDLSTAYHICSAYPDAITATHDTLTVPAKTATATRASSTDIDFSSATARTEEASQAVSTPTSSAPSFTNPTESGGATPGVMASMTSTPPSASAESAGARSAPKHPTSLSTAEATGISVACMGVVVLAIGIWYLVLYIRRRNVKVRNEKQERDSYDFVDEAPPRFSPFHYGYADPRGPLGGFYGQRAELMSEKRDSHWYRQFPREPGARFEKGLDYSPKSLHSRSTISQLLPDKPKATPPQLRTKPSSRPPSNFTAPTVFEEDRSPQMYSAMFPPPMGLPANPKALRYPSITKPQQAQYVNQYSQSPVSMRQPSLSIEIPKQAARVVKSPAQAHVPAPNLGQRSPVQRERRVSEARSSRSAASFLNYYASPDADALRSPESPTPIDDHAQTRRAVPTAITVTKPTYPPRAVRVVSGASDTSFESTDPDEPTPPDEGDKQLTPVKEHSPIAGVKYPKVPRSSNQAIPRSPPIGMKTSPSIGARISPSPRQTRPPNALPVGAHARRSPRQAHNQPQQAQTQQRAPGTRPTSQIPRKPLPSYQRQQQPVTPQRQVNQNSNLSGSTLAAKRRGDTAAHDLERGLHIQDSARAGNHTSNTDKPLPPPGPATRRSPHNSPLKGYGRVASRNNSPVATRPPGFPQSQQQQAQRRYPVRPTDGTTGYRQPGTATTQPPVRQEAEASQPLKSPLWEPKLTPSRKGEDLYLQVGSATPRTGQSGLDGGSETEYRGRGM